MTEVPFPIFERHLRDEFFQEMPWRQTNPMDRLVALKYTLLICNLIHERMPWRGLWGIIDDTNPFYEEFKEHVLIIGYILAFWALLVVLCR